MIKQIPQAVRQVTFWRQVLATLEMDRSSSLLAQHVGQAERTGKPNQRNGI